AINVNEYSTNESVFEFTQHFGLEMPAVSGEGGGSHVADIYEIPFTPFFTIVSPEGYIVWDTAIFITSRQEWLDTMANYGVVPTVCSGTDILFYEAKTDVDTFIASIDAINKDVYLQIPQFVDVSELEIFMISSSKSEVFFEGNIQNKDSSVVDLSDSLLTYTVFAENASVFSDWNIILQTLPVYIEGVDDFFMYFDYQNKHLNFSDAGLVEQYYVFDISGRQQFKVTPTVSSQNFNALPTGVYIIVAELINGKILNQKIIIK
ncbi:MAG: T9SS type A sorting domain-containing protein, partial [Bacteroidales bacterium]|nr:T9SS type A sorting domain-containing protein [Bacteroidales bacterium]